MLLPPNVVKMMQELNYEFDVAYGEIIGHMNVVMLERGAIRDKDTPIYLRRSPEQNLGIVHGKIYRVESLLAQIAARKPRGQKTKNLLRKVIEECVDIANYVIFIAALCKIVLVQLEGDK